MSCFRPTPVWFMDACWPQSMQNWSKELGRYCEWSCCRRRVNWKEGIEKTDGRRHQRAEERRARRKNSSSFPSSIIICAVCSASGDRHSRIGLHSYTSRCNTTTDWLGRTNFVSRYFVFQLHVLGPGRSFVTSQRTSMGRLMGRRTGKERFLFEEGWLFSPTANDGTKQNVYFSQRSVSFASWRSTKTEKLTESKEILCWPQTSSWVAFRFPRPRFSQSKK